MKTKIPWEYLSQAGTRIRVKENQVENLQAQIAGKRDEIRFWQAGIHKMEVEIKHLEVKVRNVQHIIKRLQAGSPKNTVGGGCSDPAVTRKSNVEK